MSIMDFKIGTQLRSEAVKFFDADWVLLVDFTLNDENEEYLGAFIMLKHDRTHW